VYQLNSPGFLRIDPSSGDALNPFGKIIPLGQYKLFPSLPVPAAGGTAAGRPGAAGRPAQKINQAEAQNTAREFFKKLGFEGEVTHSGGSRSDDGIFVDEEWSFTLKDEESWKTVGPRRHRSVGIDTRTGEVKSYHDSDYFEYAGTGSGAGAVEQDVTRDTARARAMEFIRLVHPERLGQVIEEQEHYEYSYPGSKERQFSFVRLVNGIPFMRDGIRISVSAGGEIVSYSCDWHTVEFPDTAGVITREEAERIFLENITLKPLYFFLQEEDKPWPGKRPVLSLAFNAHWGEGIDARTGQPVVMDWQKVRTEKKGASMVPQGHWAATPLALLAGSGLLPEEGFDPDGPVSRRDAVRVLMSANGAGYHAPGEGGETSGFGDIAPNDRDYAVIQAAEQRGILEGGGNFSPEQPVTRETFAIWLVRALGYKEIANMPVKIEIKLADAELVNENSRNYVAIACGLGLMQGDENGLFRPSDNITWAELSSLVTRAMPRLHTGNLR
ncbi:MAG: S-layer homology domain-containing protein, partial [Firmicutes bacterium]|nr:S-layer homology domain-containing protein [Bacillota bacterium]